jgi:transcriptional regulator with XRE-family HTH domain
MDVKEYLKLVLKKKGLTYEEFCNEVNKVKASLGDKSIIRRSNLSNYFNSDEKASIKTLIIYEKALGLKPDTLVNMVDDSSFITTKRKNKKVREKLYNE